MEPRAEVKNTADPQQVKRAGRRVDRRADHRHTVLATQLNSYIGREFVWQELVRHGIDDLVDGTLETICKFLGKREAGMELKVEVMQQHPVQFLQMQHEAIERMTREAAELDASTKRTE